MEKQTQASKTVALEKITDLVNRFRKNLDTYRGGAYNETQVRREYIDPFWKALGWDIDNEKGEMDAYKDVIHEDKVRVEGRMKAPDYCFKIKSDSKFYLEAKKPSIFIKGDIHPAIQVRSYGWNRKLAISLLMDFEEFAVYDCSKKPKKDDKPAIGRISYMTFEEYGEQFDFLWENFSREAAESGRFDKYARASSKGKTGDTVDKEFLKSMDAWRVELAKNIAVNNEKLAEEDINRAVQLVIDRILFLRICEGREVEANSNLTYFAGKENCYKGLCKYFKQADDKYNSGIFDFSKDSLTPNIKIDDNVITDILKELYYGDYNFEAIPVEILGNAYEQFLGKVIRLTAGHHAKVEEKPEVRKAGGVYYTPQYIVDYIVKNTVGKLVEGKKPNEVAKLRVCDPACGSGSFLLGAYQFLLDWHMEWYQNHPEDAAGGKKKESKLTPNGRLTTSEKKRILLNNIYGVDIDSQAVEVTKLSLLLKALEGETDASIHTQLELFHERILPNLEENIRCGNSLIGPDYFSGSLIPDTEELKRVNPFDWKAAFPHVFEAGGFDAVIGNPPYGFHQIHTAAIKPYLKENYSSAQGSFEHYFLFYEKGLSLLKSGGVHGYIAPVTWLTIPSAKSLRKVILDEFAITEINWLPELVFANAQVNTLISIIKADNHDLVFIKIIDELNSALSSYQEKILKQSNFIKADYYIGIFENEIERAILEKGFIDKIRPLGEIARPCSGYNPYEVGKGQAPEGGLQTKDTVISKPYHSIKKINEDWKQEVIGRDLSRYFLNISGNRWIKYGPWLAAPRDKGNFLGHRLLVQEITGGKSKRIIASYCDKEIYHSRDVIPIKCENALPHPFFLLGVLNSWLITWYHHKRNPKAQKGLFPKVLVSDLAKLPIRTIDFTDPADKSRHDTMVSLVDKMLELHKRQAESTSDSEKESLRRIIDDTDRQIDALVYELYGLTEEEIRIVEGKE